jgi:N-acetylmuramoyl-L-alanine amidase
MALFTPRKRTDFIVVHTTATPEGRDFDVRDIEKMHRDRGFNGVGYHFVVKLDGTVQTGRPQEMVGAHVENHNATSVALSYVGGVDAKGKAKDTRADAQKAAMRELIIDLMTAYPNATVLGHRDFPKVRKDCPCFDVRTWWKRAAPVEFAGRVAPLMPGSFFNPKG